MRVSSLNGFAPPVAALVIIFNTSLIVCLASLFSPSCSSTKNPSIFVSGNTASGLGQA